MTLFVDLDGVLADFDTHYRETVGPLPDRWRTDYDHDAKDEVDWAKIDKQAFYLSLPLMRDADDLWAYVLPHNPIILTGVPSKVGTERAAANKRTWVMNRLGPKVPVITCASREKHRFAKPGDVLIDDWEKYKVEWLRAGGVWITHVSAEHTVFQLRRMGL